MRIANRAIACGWRRFNGADVFATYLVTYLHTTLNYPKSGSCPIVGKPWAGFGGPIPEAIRSQI